VSYILVWGDPESGEQRAELVADKIYRIGSMEDNDIVLTLDDVSRHHAVLRVSASGLHITDLKSKNGTFVNGNRVAAAEFHCGDQLNLSSAVLVVLEDGGDPSSAFSEADWESIAEAGTGLAGETHHFRGKATVEDMADLLEAAASSVKTGSLSDLLNWPVIRLGLTGATVVYLDDASSVAMVGSAGDPGPLLKRSETLARLAQVMAGGDGGGRSVRHVIEESQQMLVAPVGSGYALVLSFSGKPPAVADVRAMLAAVEIALASRRAPGPAGPAGSASAGEGGPPLTLEALVGRPLAEARGEVERYLVSRALGGTGGNQTEAARQLGLSRAGLFKLIRRLGVPKIQS